MEEMTAEDRELKNRLHKAKLLKREFRGQMAEIWRNIAEQMPLVEEYRKEK